MFIYESHMSGLFTSDYPIDYEQLYCETVATKIGKLENLILPLIS